MTKQKVMEASETFREGDMVSHPKFGEGEVLSCEGKVAEVKFADGIRKLALGFAPLKKR